MDDTGSHNPTPSNQLQNKAHPQWKRPVLPKRARILPSHTRDPPLLSACLRGLLPRTYPHKLSRLTVAAVAAVARPTKDMNRTYKQAANDFTHLAPILHETGNMWQLQLRQGTVRSPLWLRSLVVYVAKYVHVFILSCSQMPGSTFLHLCIPWSLMILDHVVVVHNDATKGKTWLAESSPAVANRPHPYRRRQKKSMSICRHMFFLHILSKCTFHGPFRDASATCAFASARAISEQQLPWASAD